MFNISLKPWHSRLALATLAGVCTFLAFERYLIVPLIIVAPYLFARLSLACPTHSSAFRWGFFSSCIIMVGGFYWVTHVLEEFGQLSTAFSLALFVGFCGFGALNFPLFTFLLHWFSQKLDWQNRNEPYRFGIWVSLAIPALFSVVEWGTPKLFPWMVGHSLFRSIWAIQITEFTGVSFLSFALFSLSITVGSVFWGISGVRAMRKTLVIPLLMWGIIGVVGWQRLSASYLASIPSQSLRVALVQGNIGSLDKLDAHFGNQSKIDTVLARYLSLTERALSTGPKPDLFVWPETAMPFLLDQPSGYLARLHDAIKQWKVPILTGGYARGALRAGQEYNSSALITPSQDGIQSQYYHKHILLAFGEYLPLGEAFPSLYRMFPQVANFARGFQRDPVTLPGGIRLGATICYEAIVPRFVRESASHGIQMLINLSNDSWFGKTSEPYLHASLTIFRAVELRVPIARVTNTGTSLIVDLWGRITSSSPIFEEAVLVENIQVPLLIKPTMYQVFGDWVLVVFALILGYFLLPLRRH